jgi:hypothetical protein
MSFSQAKMIEYYDDDEDDDEADCIHSSVSDDVSSPVLSLVPHPQFFITNAQKGPSAQSYTFSSYTSIPSITITPPSPPPTPCPSCNAPPESLLPIQDEQFGMLQTVPNALTSNRSLQQDIEGNWHVFNRGEWGRLFGALMPPLELRKREGGWLTEGDGSAIAKADE